MKNWFKPDNILRIQRVNPITHKIEGEKEYIKFRIRPIFKWFDLWVGVYVDQHNKFIYIFPIPMFGFKIGYQFKRR